MNEFFITAGEHDDCRISIAVYKDERLGPAMLIIRYFRLFLHPAIDPTSTV